MAVVILGGGVSGLTTGIALAEAGVAVTIRAPEIAEGTLSVAAGAIWGPYLVEPLEQAKSWGMCTLEVLRRLARDPESGVRTPTGMQATRHNEGPPAWGALLDDFRECSSGLLPAGFVRGWRFSAPVIEMARYLPYLSRRFAAAGGRVERRSVMSLAGAAASAADGEDSAEVLVNCTGVYARRLAHDLSLIPVRGQAVVVENPGIEEFFVDQRGEDPRQIYWFPQGDVVVLGGSLERGMWGLEPDPCLTERIVDDCTEIEPAFAKARVLDERVGLRPVRSQVRVESDMIGGVPIVHNYGHGGAGVSLSWGCAETARDLVTQALGR